MPAADSVLLGHLSEVFGSLLSQGFWCSQEGCLLNSGECDRASSHDPARRAPGSRTRYGERSLFPTMIVGLLVYGKVSRAEPIHARKPAQVLATHWSHGKSARMRPMDQLRPILSSLPRTEKNTMRQSLRTQPGADLQCYKHLPVKVLRKIAPSPEGWQ